jgi:hypothetical protein
MNPRLAQAGRVCPQRAGRVGFAQRRGTLGETRPTSNER